MSSESDQQHWSQQYSGNGSWEWSAGRWVLADDGITDTRDVGAADAPASQVAAADYWAMAAEVAASSAGIAAAQAGLADAEEQSPHSQAVLHEAFDRHVDALTVLDEVQAWRTEVRAVAGECDTDRLPADNADVADPDPVTTQAIYDYLVSPEYAEGLSNDELFNYLTGVHEDAEQLAAGGYDVARLQADDAAIADAAEFGEDLTPEGQIAVEDELLALADMERLATQQEAADAEASHEAFVARHGQVQEMYDQLYDPAEYARVEGDGRREDAYCDSVWDHAGSLVDAGATVEEYRSASEWATELEAAEGADALASLPAEDLSRLADEQTAAMASESAPDSWAELNPGAEWAANEDAAAARVAFTEAVDDQLREHGREPAAPGATDEALANLLYELDQARCALDDDATPEEDRHSWEQQVEHLEDQVASAQGVPHGEVFPAAPQAASPQVNPQSVDGADAEAWGVPDGTPVDELPQTYAEWRAEGQDGSAADGELGDDPPDGIESPSDELVEAEAARGYQEWSPDAPLASTAAVAEAHAAVEASEESADVSVAEPATVSASADVDE